ncbi:NAD/NADP octopine/nopaline dehydrogenase family protein [Desulfovibrio sp. OttesenSCG-928-O18]|nr:NAD/NADP octopine/nopaline dehydrogenase family protein [Desulfovibrio sp. OttesenSCG-928-O18]
MNVCVIGGGGIGSSIACYAAASGGRVTVYTSRPEDWTHEIIYTDKGSGISRAHQLHSATNNPAEAFGTADIVFLTYPSFMRCRILQELPIYLKQGAVVVLVPGFGGAEHFCNRLIERGHLVFGLDRAPCVGRVSEYGKSVVASLKTSVRGALLRGDCAKEIADMVGGLLGLKCTPLDNYLVVALTPSNPILHTTRLYEIFRNVTMQHTFSSNILFYREWGDLASEMLFACDKELQNICSSFSELNLSEVISLRQHYESETPEQLTKKIRSIATLDHIYAPMVEDGGVFVPNLKSRYFTEDFPFGLCILKELAVVGKVATPCMDEILQWYFRFSSHPYCNWGDIPIPQNFGILTKQDVYRFYGRKTFRFAVNKEESVVAV